LCSFLVLLAAPTISLTVYGFVYLVDFRQCLKSLERVHRATYIDLSTFDLASWFTLAFSFGCVSCGVAGSTLVACGFFVACGGAGSTLILYTIYDFKRLLPTWQGPALAFLTSLVYTVATCAGIVLGNWMRYRAWWLPDYAPSVIFMAWFAAFQLFLIFDAVTPCWPPQPACVFCGLLLTTWVLLSVFAQVRLICMEPILDFSHAHFACNNM
jgi:hypothetical protein